MPPSKLNLVVKIGTAALGAKGGTADGLPDRGLLGALVAELAALKQAGHNVILVSSGAVGTGRALLRQRNASPLAGEVGWGGAPKKAKAGSRSPPSPNPSREGRGIVQITPDHPSLLQHCDPVAEKQILASLGQARLMTLYQELLLPHGLLAAQILLTRQDFRTRAHHKHMLHLFAALQKQPQILPIINENDSVTVDELMFTDNDELAGLLAAMMNADRLIILSHIAGVYDRPPDEDGAAIIPLIDWAEKKSVPSATQGKSRAGRGGMTAKLASARKLAALGITTHIAAARETGIVQRLLEGETIGTKILPLPEKKSGKRNAVKRWLASDVNKAPAAVTANDCLAVILRKPNQAISLLPVGLTGISGEFAKGDLVRIVDESGATLALGVARYDGATLRQALGKKQQPVFIHYDQLHRVSADESA